MVTVKLESDVHQMFKILAKRYKKSRNEKGKVSISDAARFFIEEHDQRVAIAASAITESQEEAASTGGTEDEF
jgi:hypothetical protein